MKTKQSASSIKKTKQTKQRATATKQRMQRNTGSTASSTSASYWFDDAAAQRAVDFFTECLVHTKGEWAGKPFQLAPWQEHNIIRPLFGWKRADGARKYRTCFVEVPRKNGKSALAAGIALYLLFADREPGAEIVSAASDREQAAIVFEMAQQMVEQSPVLRKRAEIYRRAIVVPKTRSTYKVISAEAYSKHGLNLHGALIDEVHAHPDRELIDVLRTSVAARRQPVIFMITTAGYSRESICYELHTYAQRVASGEIVDETFLPVLFSAPADADWTDPRVWQLANPNLGVSVKYEYLEQECQRAREVPAYENTFRRLHLCQWTEQYARWMPMAEWDACAIAPVSLDTIAGRTVYVGIDLSSTTDLTSVTYLVPADDGIYHAGWMFFVPEDNLHSRARRDRADYPLWVTQRYITPTPGNIVDQQYILQWILKLGESCRIKEIAYDPWNATGLIAQLQDHGAQCVPVRQGFASLSAPTKALLSLVLARQLNHGGNPVARWCMSNAVVKTDPAGNIKLDRGRSSEKIDACISLVLALSRALAHSADTPESVYDSRGVMTIETL